MTPEDSAKNLSDIVQKGASRPLRKWLIIAVIAALLVGGFFYLRSRGDAAGDAPEYTTQPLEQGDISLVITASGNLAPTNQVSIGSELSGTAQEVLVDTNDPVKKGQTLARLESSKLAQQTERSRAALVAAKAKVSQSKATLRESEAAYARQQDLHKLSGGRTPSKATMETSLATVERAKADLESADAAVAGAEAEVKSFERDMEKTIIRSPIDGVVLTRSIEVGQTVAASFTAPVLFTIAEDLKKMELIVAVAEADIGRVAVGQTATFSVDAWPGRSYTALVKKVSFGTTSNAAATGSASKEPGTGGIVSYSTELEVANDDLSLRPGMTASVDISIISKNNILRVPNAALRFDPVAASAITKPVEAKRTLVQRLSLGGGRRWSGGPAVTKASPSSKGPRVWVLVGNKPVEVLVKTGITDGLFTEVTGDDLSENTQVIVSIKPVTTS
jgi:HlyD family secretion protein